MATSRLSSNTPDLQDVSATLIAFEEINKCKIILFGRVAVVRGARELSMIVTAEELEADIPDPPVLASVNVHLTSGQHRSLEAAIMWALYQLDWKLQQMREGNTTETA